MGRLLELKEPATAVARLRDQEKQRIHEIHGLPIVSVDKSVRVEDVVEGGRLPPGGEPGTQGVVVGHRPRRSRVGYRSAGKPDQTDQVAGIVTLRPEEDRPAALKRLETLIKDLNEKPGHLLPGVRLVLVCRSREAGKWLAYDSEGKTLHIQATFPFDTSLARIAETMQTVRGLIVEHPEVQSVLTLIGEDSRGQAPKGVSCVVLLRPGKDRAGLADDLRAELTAKVPGVPWEVTPDCRDPFLQAFEAAPGEHLLKIIGPDFDRLEALAHQAKKKLGEIKGVKDVVVRHLQQRNDLEFRVDPDKCKKWGIQVAVVNAFIESALRGPRIIAGAGEGEKKFDIAVGRRMLRDERSILDLPVDIQHDEVVPGHTLHPRIPLRVLVSPVAEDGNPDPKGSVFRAGPAVIYREQGRRLIAVRFRVTAEEKTTLAEAKKKVSALLEPTYRAVWDGGD
jgi:cobalt-zinc-cadmium resistance protein CzcA